MTIKELKEQINKDSSNLSKFEKEVIESNVLNLFNENLKVEQIIQNKFIFVSMIRHFYRKYDNTLDKESKKFINYIIARYPHLMFDYEIIDENTAEIKYQYIFNNKLKKGSIKYQKGDISILCYDTYLSQMFQDIGAEMEKEINNNDIQQPAIKLAINNLKR